MPTLEDTTHTHCLSVVVSFTSHVIIICPKLLEPIFLVCYYVFKLTYHLCKVILQSSLTFFFYVPDFIILYLILVYNNKFQI